MEAAATPAIPALAARRARGAVGALFFTNGALFANVVPRYPELKAELKLSNAAFGSAVAGYGLGALVAGLLAGVLISRWGSARVATLCALGLSGNVVLIALAPSWWTFATVLFVTGSLDSVADIANNAHSLRVERRYGRSILNSLHGLWSIGAVVGGSMGAAAAGLALPLVWHLSIAACLVGALAVTASRFLLPGPDDAELPVADLGELGSLRRLGRLGIGLSVVALGTVAASAELMEQLGATWGAVYLREDLGAAAAVSGLGFIALQTSQTVGRLLGDRFVTRYGDRAVARTGATLAAVAMAGALAVPTVVSTVLAFAAVGLGIGTLIPAGLRAADEIPGLPRGVGLALVGTVLRVALMVAPPLIGLAADAYSLRAALVAMPVLAVIGVVLAGVLPAAPMSRQGDRPASGVTGQA